MKLELTIPKALRGRTEMLDALNAVQGNARTGALVRPILEIVTRALAPSIQQEFFDNFDRYAGETNLPQQAEQDIRLTLDLPEAEVEAARGDLIDLAMTGSEWIWQSASDGQAAAVFEVLCDILEEGLMPADQQALLNANLSDLAD